MRDRAEEAWAYVRLYWPAWRLLLAGQACMLVGLALVLPLGQAWAVFGALNCAYGAWLFFVWQEDETAQIDEHVAKQRYDESVRSFYGSMRKSAQYPGRPPRADD